ALFACTMSLLCLRSNLRAIFACPTSRLGRRCPYGRVHAFGRGTIRFRFHLLDAPVEAVFSPSGSSEQVERLGLCSRPGQGRPALPTGHDWLAVPVVKVLPKFTTGNSCARAALQS